MLIITVQFQVTVVLIKLMTPNADNFLASLHGYVYLYFRWIYTIVCAYYWIQSPFKVPSEICNSLFFYLKSFEKFFRHLSNPEKQLPFII